MGGIDGTELAYQIFDLPFIQQVLVNHYPTPLFGFLVRVQFASQVPQVLARVKEIDDLNRAREVLIGKVPDPFGSIADHDRLFGAAQTAPPDLRVELPAKLFGCFNRADVSGRSGIANSVALFVPGGLGEHASQLGLPRVGRVRLSLARPARGLLFYDG